MKKMAVSLLCVLAVGTAAASPTEDLQQCLSLNSTGQDRVDLARWIFTAMSTHPAFKSLAVISPQEQEAQAKKMAGVFTRLIAETCVAQAKAVVKQSGPAGLSQGFEFLGKLAMQELTANPAVAQSFTAPSKYVDSKRLQEALQ